MADISYRHYLPWTDRAGRFSWLKFACLVAVSLPAVWMVLELTVYFLSPKPVTYLIHDSGDWAIRFLIVALAISPLRYILRQNRLIAVRRIFGLAALFYTIVHIVVYCAGLDWDVWAIGTEIIERLYIEVGLAATIVLVAMGITSNDKSVRDLGSSAWNRLHGWIYLATVLSLLHFLLEDRTDADEVMLLSGALVFLVGIRGLRRTRFGVNFWTIFVLAILSGIAAAAIEVGYYGFLTGVDWRLILRENFEYQDSIRPSWWVALIGIATAVLVLIRDRFAGAKPRPGRAPGGAGLSASA